MAVVYYGGRAQYKSQRQKFEEKMTEKKNNKVGMWADKNVQLPAEYKRYMRNR